MNLMFKNGPNVQRIHRESIHNHKIMINLSDSKDQKESMAIPDILLAESLFQALPITQRPHAAIHAVNWIRSIRNINDGTAVDHKNSFAELAKLFEANRQPSEQVKETVQKVVGMLSTKDATGRDVECADVGEALAKAQAKEQQKTYKGIPCILTFKGVREPEHPLRRFECFSLHVNIKRCKQNEQEWSQWFFQQYKDIIRDTPSTSQEPVGIIDERETVIDAFILALHTAAKDETYEHKFLAHRLLTQLTIMVVRRGVGSRETRSEFYEKLALARSETYVDLGQILESALHQPPAGKKNRPDRGGH